MDRISSIGNPRIALAQFPGSNCDADCIDAFKRLFGIELVLVWHQETALPRVDGLILPGGFSYGDYLRGGALASCSPIMPAIRSFAQKGGAILGICNGFQILTESHLLPGILLRNAQQNFVCKNVDLVVSTGDSGYHRRLKGRTYQIPIAHGEGRYHIGQDGLKALEDREQILFQYGDAAGNVHESANPNGSQAQIAGILSENGRILGMMPHPERASDPLLGSEDGRLILEAFLATVL